MKLAMIGSRTVSPTYVVEALRAVKQHFPETTQLVSGGARGADGFTMPLTTSLSLQPPIIHPAKWDEYGKVAGFKRNTFIARDANAGLAIVDKPLKESRGTYDTVCKLRAQGKPVVVYLATAEGRFELLEDDTKTPTLFSAP